MISPGEWPGLRGLGCTIFGGVEEQGSLALLPFKVEEKNLLIEDWLLGQGYEVVRLLGGAQLWVHLDMACLLV
jgi:hypothetical protein